MHYARDYVDQLMKKTMQFFTTDEDKPPLPTPPPPLASSYTHPIKTLYPYFQDTNDILYNIFIMYTNYGVKGGS